jgi:putative membrane protein
MLDTAQRTAIAAAVQAAETRTSAEIVCMVVRSSVGDPWLGWALAGIFALVCPYPLLLLTDLPALDIFLIQAAGAIALGLIASQPSVQRALLPRRTQARLVRQAAEAAFGAHGLAATRDRNGVLIFVSAIERRVEVVVDAGVAERIEQGTWQALVDALTAACRAGQMGQGLYEAVAQATNVLAPSFPPRGGDRNELPDLLVED